MPSVTLPKTQFLKIVKSTLITHSYTKPDAIRDFNVACDVQDKKVSFTILLGGTSGCGKSTLASLLASRMGITTVISTDHIRHMLRAFIPKSESPILWSSTYHAGEALNTTGNMSTKEKIIMGWEAQNAIVIEHIDELIGKCEARKESLIVEGVHLSSESMVRLLRKHPSCIPFAIYISNEAKHRERFAIRSKYMTIDPNHNKYVKYIKNIRVISDYLCKTSDAHQVPKIDNTNIDRSLATMHTIIFNCIKRVMLNGESFWNKEQDVATLVFQEYEKVAFYSTGSMLKILDKKEKERLQSEAKPEPEPKLPDTPKKEEILKQIKEEITKTESDSNSSSDDDHDAPYADSLGS